MQRADLDPTGVTPDVWHPGRVVVRLTTTAGDVLVELATGAAPHTTQAFLRDLDKGRFSDLQFVRVVRHDNDNGRPRIEVVQAMPRMPDIDHPPIPHESTAQTGLRHCDGAVSLARSEAGETTPAAFFICIGDQPALDHGGARSESGEGFAVFGQVTEGMDVVRSIHGRTTRPDAPHAYLSGQLLEAPVTIVQMRREARDAPDLLSNLLDDYWQFKLREFPLETSGAGDGPHEEALAGGSLRDHERRMVLATGMLARAHSIPVHDLCGHAAQHLQLLVGQLGGICEAWRFGDHLTPRLYPFGFTEVPIFLAGSTPLATIHDFERFVARLRAVPAYVDGHLETLRLAVSEGYRLPRVLVPRVRGLVEAQTGEHGFSSMVSERFAHRPPGVDEAAFSALAQAAREAFEHEVQPALRRVLGFLDGSGEDLVRDTVSICDQPNGRHYYRFRVRQQTTTDLEPDEIHAIGLQEVHTIQAELQTLLRDTDCDAASYAARLGRAGVAPGASELRERACVVAKRIDGVLPQAFGRLPRVTFDIRSFSPEQSRHRPIAMAQASPADRSLPGVFWITSLPERCPLHLLVSLTLHEAWPGHLMQLAVARELDHLPMFRRHGSFEYNAYIEGWALYCERLGHDLGLYDDPRDRFGQLANDLWRAARLVVDTGIHWRGWSRSEAIDYLSCTAFLPLDTIEAEVDRYIGMPAQALSYKIGERTIRALRAEAETKLGSMFSLRDFHDAVLETGAVSLDVLQQHVRAWMGRRAQSS